MTTSQPLTTDARGTQPDLRRAARGVATAAIVAAAANLVVYAVARLLDAELLVPEGPGSDTTIRLGPGPVVVATVLPLVVAGVLAVVLARRARRPARAFTAVVVAGLVLSFVPLLTADLSAGTTVALALMHPIVAGAALAFVRPEAGRDGR
jgi:hypothetical protein